jgi:hypothetical protein
MGSGPGDCDGGMGSIDDLACELTALFRLDGRHQKIVPWHRGHHYLLTLRPHERETFLALGDVAAEEFLRLSGSGLCAFSGIDRGGVPAICFGLIPTASPGVAEAWLLGGARFFQHAFSISRGARAFFPWAATRWGLSRVDILVRSDFVLGAQWARFLYFIQGDPVLNAMGSGLRYDRWSRTFTKEVSYGRHL